MKTGVTVPGTWMIMLASLLVTDPRLSRTSHLYVTSDVTAGTTNTARVSFLDLFTLVTVTHKRLSPVTCRYYASFFFHFATTFFFRFVLFLSYFLNESESV